MEQEIIGQNRMWCGTMAAQGASELIHASRQGWDWGMTISSTPLALDPLGNSVSQFLSKHLLAFPADFIANHQLCCVLRSFLVISSDLWRHQEDQDRRSGTRLWLGHYWMEELVIPYPCCCWRQLLWGVNYVKQHVALCNIQFDSSK